MSQFAFFQTEWAAVFEAASKAEHAVYADPRAARSRYAAKRGPLCR